MEKRSRNTLIIIIIIIIVIIISVAGPSSTPVAGKSVLFIHL